jgi:outer membrane receptor protein involved in Fe transport
VGALDGFGINANLTLIDSKTADVDTITGSPLGVTGVADTNYNIVGYFEKWGFSARASYTFRDTFLLIRNSATTGGAEFTEPYGQLDATLSYDITPDLTINFQAVNITGEDTRRFAGRPELFRFLVQTDRRLIGGIRARF